MTWAEWRATYSGIPVVQPYTDAPEVFLVSGRDPLIHGGSITPDPPINVLYTLDDYHVTSENRHRGSFWVAPKVERDDWTRTDYMRNRVSHAVYYLSLARLIGLLELARLVLSCVATREQLVAAFVGQDEHLNTILLARWDGLHHAVHALVQEHNKARNIMGRSWCGQPLRPGTICWSLSESVCVAKAVGRYIAQGGVIHENA